MPRIHQLPPLVVTQIAAGEVIERPASVVKELLENSIDAGASRIDIDLEQGGTELIRVVDDGCGIDADDLPLAFASHATSKLRDADDLFRIGTMGFRGEALASIGSVMQVTLQSRPKDQASGSEIQCAGGVLSPVRPWGGSPGTRIEARHLFFNIPARKKFLKSQATELGHITETVTRLALANHALHLVLRHNGKSVFEVPASATFTDRIGLFFGAEVRDSLYEVDSGPGPIRISGYIADPSCDRGNAKLQYLFLNGRWIRDRSLGHALQEGYRGLLMTGRDAVGFLFLDVPPDIVDVNVHPTKAEVRFRDSSLLYSLVRSAVKTRLLRANLVPQLRVTGEEPIPEPMPAQGDPSDLFPPTWAIPQPQPAPLPMPGANPISPRNQAATNIVAPWETRLHEPEALATGPPDSETPSLTLPARNETPLADAPSTPIIPPFVLPAALAPGSALQVHDAYIVLETPDGMLVIDQHALHERILYEQLRRRIRAGKLEIQRLLIPEPIDLPADQAALVLDAADSLAELGLEVSDFGGNTILLSSYPTLLSRRPPHEILQGVIDHLISTDRAPSKEVLFERLLATMACKAAVKAGDRLPPEEIAHLLHLRQFAEDSHHCPHGRPTSLLFSRQQLDRQFGRT